MNHGGDEENPIPEEASLEQKEFLMTEPEASVSPELAEMPTPEGGEISGEPESFNPAIAVDEMLSAEVLPEGMDALPEPPASETPLPESPSFQLQFLHLEAEARVAMKKALEAQGIQVSEKAWAAAVPVTSQLSEFQVISLLQTARALGVHAKAGVVTPAQAPTEEDLALGDLSAIPETALVMVESAPSVTLPKGEREVLLSTPDKLPGGHVRETFGIVLAHRSIARRLFREEDLKEKLQKELRSVPNRGGAPLPSSHLQQVLRELMLDLRKQALGRGANSVLGVKIEAFPESSASDPQLEQLRLVAFGTAAVVEKESP